MDFKSILEKLQADLAEVEKAARKLENQNLGDILASAKAKISQAFGHPDVNAAAAIHNADRNMFDFGSQSNAG
jgi:hypothetical protein